MFEATNLQPDHPADEWPERSEFWSAESARLQRKRLTRERNTNSVILTGHGCSLRIDGGALVIKQGFTHYPQRQESHRYFKGDLTLPRMIVLLDGSGSLSFDVLSWLGEQGVALARIKWNGDVTVFASGAGFVADAGKLRWQYETQADEALRYDFARKLIRRKLLNSIEMLEAQFEPGRLRETAISKARDGATRLLTESVRDMNIIRSIEGECAAAYFAAWADIEMRWTARSRYPIPDQWQTFRSRSSSLTGRKPKNWKASHPINAMLNYAYAVRAAQLQIQAVADGFDPYAGIMHHSRPDFPAYVYDLIEPERPKVDQLIIEFALGRRFSGADFVLRVDGVCRLSPQLARAIAVLTSKGVRNPVGESR
jgi:CRISPR-associated protein Cas1